MKSKPRRTKAANCEYIFLSAPADRAIWTFSFFIRFDFKKEERNISWKPLTKVFHYVSRAIFLMFVYAIAECGWSSDIFRLGECMVDTTVMSQSAFVNRTWANRSEGKAKTIFWLAIERVTKNRAETSRRRKLRFAEEICTLTTRAMGRRSRVRELWKWNNGRSETNGEENIYNDEKQRARNKNTRQNINNNLL